jgi:hypothetical protein
MHRAAARLRPVARSLRSDAFAVSNGVPVIINKVYGADRAPAQVGSAVMVTLLWILAVVLVIAGIFAIFRGQMLWGIVLIIVGLLVGPGGVSVFT